VPVDLAELLAGRALPGGRPVDPHDHPGALPVAVLTMEIQRGVMGDLATFPELAAAAASLVGHTARLLRAARAAGVPVVHCVAEFRADRAGTITNTPLHSAVRARPEHLLAGTPATELVPELGVEETDLVSRRRHGVSPFTGTDLHTTFSNLGARVLVVTGVSLNLGIIGTCVEAVNLGYQVVVPTDAVTGIPADYAAAVVANTLALVATLTTVDELLDALQASPGVSARRA